MTFAAHSDIRETATSPGTSAFTLNGALDSSYWRFRDRYADGGTFLYSAKGAASGSPARELGRGTLNVVSGGADTITRSVIKSTNGNALVDFATGTVDIIDTNVAPSDLAADELVDLQMLFDPAAASKSSNYTAVKTDHRSLLVLSGTATLAFDPAATLGNKWRARLRNNGVGIWTLNPDSSEQIDGQTTVKVYPGQSCEVGCDGSAFYTVGRSGPVSGDLVDNFGTSSSKEGCLPALGGSYLRTDYPALFAEIGTTYGAADGTHFNVPDCGGRVVAGKEASAARLTSAGAGIDGATLGAAGGAQTHTLTKTEAPSGLFVVNSINISDTKVWYANAYDAGEAGPSTFNVLGASSGATTQQIALDSIGSITASASTTDNGGDVAHTSTQPTIIANKFIKY